MPQKKNTFNLVIYYLTFSLLSRRRQVFYFEGQEQAQSAAVDWQRGCLPDEQVDCVRLRVSHNSIQTTIIKKNNNKFTYFEVSFDKQ